MATTILLAIDDSECSRAATNELIEQLRHESTTVHVLHVLELDKMLPAAFDFSRGTLYGAEVAAYLQKSRDDAERLVGETARRLQEAQFSTVTTVAEGDPRHTILNYAAEVGCHCIVMGSHGRLGLDRFFMGSVSEAVVRHAHCSVHVVRTPSTGLAARAGRPPASADR
ncbi:MAG: universal stress protein [Vicinamibacterales bacterium]